jgi:hypothetical protein
MNHHMTMLAYFLQGQADLTGTTFKDGVTKLAGNFFLAILGVLGVVALLRKKVVETLELVGAAIVAGIFVYAPQAFGAVANAVTTLFVH